MASAAVNGVQQPFGDAEVQKARSLPSYDRQFRRVNWATALAAAACVLSLLSCALAIYAAYRSIKLAKIVGQNAPTSGTVLLSSDPQSRPSEINGGDGYRVLGHLYQGTGYFARLAQMKYSRSDHRTVPYSSTIFIIGGQSNSAHVLQGAGAVNASEDAADAGPPRAVVLPNLVAYSTYTELLWELAQMPEPRYRHCAAVIGDDIYVAGGLAVLNDNGTNHLPVNRTLRYNIPRDTWSVLPGLATPRSDCCCAAVGGKLYVAGGWDQGYVNTLSSVEVFDPATNAWSVAPAMGEARGDLECAALDNRYLYTLGGAGDRGFSATVEKLDTSGGGAWSRAAPLLRARGDFAAEALPGGRILVLGGEGADPSGSGQHETATHSCEEYSAAADAWTPKAPLPEARFRFDATHAGERVYVFGGHPTCESGGGAGGVLGRVRCDVVGLNSTWGYMDVAYPDVYLVAPAA